MENLNLLLIYSVIITYILIGVVCAYKLENTLDGKKDEWLALTMWPLIWMMLVWKISRTIWRDRWNSLLLFLILISMGCSKVPWDVHKAPRLNTNLGCGAGHSQYNSKH